VSTIVDVKKLRQKLGLTQERFSERFGVNIGTLRAWEQGRRTPDDSACSLLAVIWHCPEQVDTALQVAQTAAM
jgi:putative transcriptional regulator